MNEINDIMVFDSLLDRFHFKFIVENHLKNSFWNIFIDNFKPSRNWKCYGTGCDLFLILFFVSFLVVGITDVMRILDGGVFNKIVHHIEVEIISVKELFINKKVLKTVGYVTLSLTMINSERSVDTDFISLLFVSSVGHELEDIFLGELFSKSDFEGADSRRSAVDGAADVILGIDVFEDNAVTEGDVLASFFRDHGFELFFFGFGPL